MSEEQVLVSEHHQTSSGRSAVTGFLVALLLAALSACAGGSDKAAEPKTSTSTPPTAPTAPTAPAPSPDATPSTIAEIQELFPRGYPKVVMVSTLPDQVRSWYEGDYKKAVAIAPGVWAALSPGATPFDVFATGSFDGFCASIKAYGRKYLDGMDPTGTCW